MTQTTSVLTDINSRKAAFQLEAVLRSVEQFYDADLIERTIDFQKSMKYLKNGGSPSKLKNRLMAQCYNQKVANEVSKKLDVADLEARQRVARDKREEAKEAKKFTFENNKKPKAADRRKASDNWKSKLSAEHLKRLQKLNSKKKETKPKKKETKPKDRISLKDEFDSSNNLKSQEELQKVLDETKTEKPMKTELDYDIEDIKKGRNSAPLELFFNETPRQILKKEKITEVMLPFVQQLAEWVKSHPESKGKVGFQRKDGKYYRKFVGYKIPYSEIPNEFWDHYHTKAITHKDRRVHYGVRYKSLGIRPNRYSKALIIAPEAAKILAASLAV